MGSGKTKVQREGHPYGLFFIKTEKSCNTDVFAKKVMGRKGVEEILLTTGEYAFVVKAKTIPEKAHEDVGRYLKERFGQCMKIESHIRYRRIR